MTYKPFNPARSPLDAALANRTSPSGRFGTWWFGVVVVLVAVASAQGRTPTGTIAYATELNDGFLHIVVRDLACGAADADCADSILQATDLPGASYDPAWTWDGTRLVFVNLSGEGSDLYIVEVADGFPLPLNLTVDLEAFAGSPAFSPTCAFQPAPCSEWIAFDTDLGGTWNILITDPQGVVVAPLTDDEFTDWFPAWSPDGSKLVFSSSRGDNGMDIHILDIKTNAIDLVVSEPGDELFATWSPDGKWIAYSVEVPEPAIKVIAADCRHPCATAPREVVSQGFLLAAEPTWSPDSRWLAFTGQAEDELDGDIYAVHVASRRIVEITDNDVNDLSPAWKP